ncbi:alpha/beta hydrolase [Streptomyces sp. NBC_00365]|uniref:alpha/beta fold hydrolase n=1 Tax=Streptomyces sp. NBC_00365 TaxID=2975726 RepID=UPI002259D611|nr:alpha/beta hydrolase [Streptomyces sp. NBC_00365]MCX5096919.1 alpha/beta hydrolase [Streptomyces sp. NBC_00365]
MSSYSTVKTLTVDATNGINYAYRSVGTDTDAPPLVLLQHFRGNLDNWDPALVDALAQGRRVITFDSRGVAATTGSTPHTIAAMAEDAVDFIAALGLSRVDLLGFSIGSFVAQEVALLRPDLVNRIVLASAAPQGASGMHGWAPDIIEAVGGEVPSAEGYLRVFFTTTEAGQAAGQAVLGRVFGGRSEGHDVPTTWATRLAQYDAVAHWGIPNHSLLERLRAITQPVFIANGDSDRMILPRYSYLLAGLLPDAEIKIYPDAAHGFLFQYHEEFAADVDAFLRN